MHFWQEGNNQALTIMEDAAREPFGDIQFLWSLLRRHWNLKGL